MLWAKIGNLITDCLRLIIFAKINWPNGGTFRARTSKERKANSTPQIGINPYPATLYPVDTNSKSIKEDFSEGKTVTIAGRLMSRRIQGKASFAELQDSEGRIQVYFNRDQICPDQDKTSTMKYTKNYSILEIS